MNTLYYVGIGATIQQSARSDWPVQAVGLPQPLELERACAYLGLE